MIHGLRFSSKQMDMALSGITNQPMGFSVAHLDPSSQMLYNGLGAMHMSARTLTTQLDGAGQGLMQDVKGRFISNKSNLTYTELLQGLIHRDENILTRDPHLQYTLFELINNNTKEITKKVEGRALLTDRRLLFLSSQFVESFSLQSYGDPKKLPGGYSMELTCKDSTYFLPIPLSRFRSVEMEGGSGVSGNIALHGIKPPCNGLFGCFGGPCLKTWSQAPMIYNEYNQLVVTFGVVMPPWDTPSYIRLFVNPATPINYIRDILSLFMQYAPNIN